MNPSQPTKRSAWLAYLIWRLKRLYATGATLPGGDRGLTWDEYTKLVQCVLGEHTEESQ